MGLIPKIKSRIEKADKDFLPASCFFELHWLLVVFFYENFENRFLHFDIIVDFADNECRAFG